MDTNKQKNLDVPRWSETRWSGCWNPDEGVGLYLHMGRFRRNLDVWWAQTVAYLPDGKLAVDRSFGPQPDEAFIRTSVYELAQKDDGWTSTFDGPGELTTTEALAAAPRGAASSVAMSWEVEAKEKEPVWDLYGGGDSLGEQAGDTHVQQAFTTSGSLTVDGETYSLDGVGYKDHSSGVRHWDEYGDHGFVLVHMPDWTAHAILMRGPGGEEKPMGAFFRDGNEQRVEAFAMPVVEDAFGGPNEHEVTITPAGGDAITLQTEILHQLPVMVTEDGDNINGIDWEGGRDPCVFLMEAAARFTGPDGEVGYGYHERGILRERIEPPAGARGVPAAQGA